MSPSITDRKPLWSARWPVRIVALRISFSRSLAGATLVFIGASVLAAFGSGCESSPPRGCAACAVAQQGNGWCDACDVGYIAGLTVKSHVLHETMDAHGHQLQVDLIPCDGCQRMARVGGYCEANRIGWHRGEAYFSRLTYELARSAHLDAANIGCVACRENSAGAGWCDACDRGMLGHFAIRVRADFDAARRDFDRLLKAIDLSGHCDYCAMAAVTDTGCFKCKLTFRDGDVVAMASD